MQRYNKQKLAIRIQVMVQVLLNILKQSCFVFMGKKNTHSHTYSKKVIFIWHQSLLNICHNNIRLEDHLLVPTHVAKHFTIELKYIVSVCNYF